MRVALLRSVLALSLAAFAGCAHSSAAQYVPPSAAGAETYTAPPLPGTAAAPASAQAPAVVADAPAEVSEQIYAAQTTYPLRGVWRRARKENALAAATPAPAPPDKAPPLANASKPETASDAVQVGPLLIYSASFLLSVYEVDKTQALLKQHVASFKGFVSMQTDTQITLRVPAPQFDAMLLAIEQAGKVRARNIQSLDVGDEYRDVELRLRTAELLRQRLETMLNRAEKVSEAMQVQAEIERIVREIEQLKGALRSFNDRIAYSTIVVEFRPEARPDIDDSEVFRLPFPFLDELGLHHLLELTP